MADDLILYTNPQSRGRIVRWMLEEVGVDYRVEVLHYGTTMKAAPYLALNPMGKVPALVHGDTVITECSAICAYLADAFPEANLAPPPTSRLRGPYYRWMFFGAGPAESAVTNKLLGFEPPIERRGMVGYGSFVETMDAIERAVSGPGPYIVGDQFTAVDVYLGSQIGFGLQFGSMEARPAFQAYWARLKARPAHVRAGELDNALLAEAAT